jgi:hypothetical protein
MGSSAPPGLCESCRWARHITTRRGAGFIYCTRSDTDPAYAKYPALPIVACAGYEVEDRGKGMEDGGQA